MSLSQRDSRVAAAVAGGAALAVGFVIGHVVAQKQKQPHHFGVERRRPLCVGAAKDQICIVTGGSRGIGAAISERLVADGFKVVVNYVRNKEKADALVQRLSEAGGNIFALQADISDPADVARMFEQAELRWQSKVTAVVNNAAVLGPLTGLLDDSTVGELDRVLATNLYGALYVLREATKRMSTSHGGLGGAVVNVSAGSAYTGSPLCYGMSKAALNSLAAGSVQELAQHGIRINTVSPGPVNTDMMADFSVEEVLAMSQQIPMGRVGEASEIAAGVAWLLSKDASYVSGANIRIAGGKALEA